MYPWLVWGGNLQRTTVILGASFSALFFFMKRQWFNVTKFNQILCLFCTLFIFSSILRGAIFGPIIDFLVWLPLIFLKKELRCHLFTFITKWFGILLGISIVFYLLWLITGFHLYSNTINWVDGRYSCTNYFFFLIPNSLESRFGIYRFQSIFMEPGHMTMGIIPLLIANKFNIKNKYVLILFIAEILSFSLAGFITMALGFVLLNLNRTNFKYFVTTSLALAMIFIIIENTQYGATMDKVLWSRLQMTEQGTISGDNRSNKVLDKQYAQIIHSSQKWFGSKDKDTTFVGAGYKVIICEKGLIGTLLALLVYLTGLYTYKTYKIGVFTFIIILLLYQNSYPSWYCIFCSYVTGIAYINTSWGHLIKRKIKSSSSSSLKLRA